MDNDDPEEKENDRNTNNYNFLQRVKDKSKEEFPNPRVWIEILALIGLTIYVCQMIGANNLTQSALKETRRQNEIQNFQWASVYGTVVREESFGAWNDRTVIGTNVQMFVKNHGKQDAKAIFVAGKAQFLRDAPQRGSLLPAPEKLKIPSPENTNKEIHIEIPWSVTDELRSDYLEGRKNLYVWGQISYNDGMRETVWDFCKYVTVKELPNINNPKGEPFPFPPMDCPFPWSARWQEEIKP